MGLNILIVEDDVVFCRLLTKFLNNNHIKTRDAQSAATAKELLAAETFDFVITDYKLPDGNGIEVLKYTQKTSNKETKKILMSRFKNEEVEQEVEGLGVLEFLKKPIKPKELLVLLEKLK